MGWRRVSPRPRQVVETSTGRASHQLSRTDIGVLLAQASRRWNDLLANAFRSAGHDEVRPAFGSVLVPLFEQDGLRIGELAERSHLAKQTMTTMVRAVERAGLVVSRPDPQDARATLVHLSARGHAFQPVATRAVAHLEELVTARLGERRTASMRASLSQLAEVTEHLMPSTA
jgi:DNA-binding MarR family transcriptional regulator